MIIDFELKYDTLGSHEHYGISQATRMFVQMGNNKETTKSLH